MIDDKVNSDTFAKRLAAAPSGIQSQLLRERLYPLVCKAISDINIDAEILDTNSEFQDDRGSSSSALSVTPMRDQILILRGWLQPKVTRINEQFAEQITSSLMESDNVITLLARGDKLKKRVEDEIQRIIAINLDRTFHKTIDSNYLLSFDTISTSSHCCLRMMKAANLCLLQKGYKVAGCFISMKNGGCFEKRVEGETSLHVERESGWLESSVPGKMIDQSFTQESKRVRAFLDEKHNGKVKLLT